MTEITLLDGSIGQELVKRAGDRPTPLWSTQVMIDHPELVREVHDAYFAAGATVATTNTYAVLRDRLKRGGLEDHLEELTETAVLAARAARDAAGQGRVAASLGPLIASYRPDICPPPEEAAKIYAEPVRLLKDRADILLIETMASVDQAEGALRAACGQGRPVWLAVTVDDDGRHGCARASRWAIWPRWWRGSPRTRCWSTARRPRRSATRWTSSAASAGPSAPMPTASPASARGFSTMPRPWTRWRQRTDLDPAAYADFAMGWVARARPSSAAAARSVPITSPSWRAASAPPGMRSSEPRVSSGLKYPGEREGLAPRSHPMT